ncbi:CRISPR-associated helicase Cas3, subtype I-F/YPEST [Oligella urethralis]|uniref:type I-F CRISPR-associated helicase Cas3f n=1 Tax=Oligella urethralis TaxID=90245 RepID=UPI00035D5104|nr:type I-F CRISPR-associated helicase Cas3f [Oligella urethralis]SUA55227.1 CRISPR-associated helicase Cas3, subtype I-F/YPEST [Oligella urethralis]SUA67917.1 CRISPR-associated helicase Cas3, subtype I-F/YPEST [Oligella urethralis]
MNILIISQCNKNALKETRRIVDQFAERTGDRSWQTQITAEGLQTLKRMLRQTARKNTAVACFWMRSRKQTELIWVVGDRSQFNDDGRTPTNRTERNILRAKSENQWNYLASIQIVSVLGALLHDLGKATVGFDHKLRSRVRRSDPYRHEWISLCLFKKMIEGCQTNAEFLTRLMEWDKYTQTHKEWYHDIIVDEEHLRNDSDTFGFESMPPLAQWISWLIVSHHRMPFYQENITPLHFDVNKFYETLSPVDFWVKSSRTIEEAPECVNTFLRLKKDPTLSKLWLRDLKRWSRKALENGYLMSLTKPNDLWNPLHLHLSRLCLMFGDHNYSSLASDSPRRVLDPERLSHYEEIIQCDKKDKEEIWANLDKDNISGKQFLDEHLVGVASMTAHFSRYLPLIKSELNALKNNSTLRKRSTNPRFNWQDRASDLVKSFSESSEERGFFGISMGSTGTGKTLGNAKIMTALSGDIGRSRLTFALGLRVLTSQTGEALRSHFDLDDESLATLVGGPVFPKPEDDNRETDKLDNGALSGSESAEHDLFFDDGEFIDTLDEGALDSELFGTVIRDHKTKQLLMTPWISCTIDHLMQVCEQQRGGRYMAPLLRILSSDVILDEPDDFGQGDLPALSRLVYWSGLLGSRVLLSSATITKDMAVGLHKAYEDGRKIWNSFLGLPNQPTICAWFDEFNNHIACYNNAELADYHEKFCKKRINKLRELPIRRKADWLHVDSKDELSAKLLEGALKLHSLNNQKTISSVAGEVSVSVGLIRFANINPMIKVLTDFLNETAPHDTLIHLVPYHSQQIQLLRANLEAKLDRILNRKKPEELFLHPEIQGVIENIHNQDIKHHIFIVFGTAVTEVGRDHDYDWAIIEPSSMRSIIQLAGRVWRHRPDKVATDENILILNQNIRALESNDIAYTKPGYESSDFKLNEHKLDRIVAQNEISNITSIARLLRGKAKITPPGATTNSTSKIARKQSRRLSQQTTSHELNNVSNALADLEHQVMKAILNDENHAVSIYRQENNAAPFTAYHSKKYPFRQARGIQESYVALNIDGDLCFKTYANALSNPDHPDGSVRHLITQDRFDHAEQNTNMKRWLEQDFTEALELVASQSGLSISQASLRYANLNLTKYGKGQQVWKYHPWVGAWDSK